MTGRKRNVAQSAAAERDEAYVEKRRRNNEAVESLQKELSFLKEMFVAYANGNRKQGDTPSTSNPQHMTDEEKAIKFAAVARDCAKTSSEAVENVEKFITALKNLKDSGKQIECKG
ncbi:unnamed protein product [Strongylus vulgaris]|uniref:BZIP domain-containing protein n=1 Tax=Strongylus vulgaris TaxID=40348 RepID=A0A3P7K5N3_STRVU|nr:unnamed protein product [Strongylus vulgaris]